MVNTNVQSPVPIIGKGYTQRDNKMYAAGEFPLLNNVFVNKDQLKSRYGINCVGTNSSSYGSTLSANKFFTDLYGFIGSHKSFTNDIIAPMLGGKNCFFGHANTGLGSTFVDVKWDPETLLAGQTNTKFQIPVKAFTYQDRNIVVTMRANEVASVINSFDYHWGQQAGGAAVPALNLIVNRPVPSSGASEQDFVDAFAWKDRLWLATRDTIYFSGIGTVANHQNFTAPVGGFIKYPGRIKSVEYMRDSLYVICEREVYVFTYNADPNTDGTNLMISGNQGGDSSCIHENTVYFTDGTSLFTVNNGSINKAMDFEIFSRPPRPQIDNNTSDVIIVGKQISTKLVAYKNKIVLFYYDMTRMGGGVSLTPYLNRGIKLAFNSNSDATMTTKGTNPEAYSDAFSEYSNCFMIDMENGSITKIMFRDIRLDAWYNGFLVDAIVVPDKNGDQVLYFMSSAHRHTNEVVGGVNYSTHNFMYRYNDGDINDNYSFANYQNFTGIWDGYYQVAGNGAGGVTYNNRVLIPFAVMIKKFVPDGSEYLMKKFRTLLATGNLPEGTKFNRFFGDFPTNLNQDYYNVAVPVTNTDPKPYRLPFNQRGRYVTLFFKRDSGFGANSSSLSVSPTFINTFQFILEDLRVLWTYTGKPLKTVGGTSVSNP